MRHKAPKAFALGAILGIFLAFLGNSGLSDPTIILLYGGDPTSAQPGTVVPQGTLGLGAWGAGASEKANFPSYFGHDSLKVNTEGFYEGARIDLPEPIDLSQFIQDPTKAFLSLRLAEGKGKAPPAPTVEAVQPGGPLSPWGPFTGRGTGVTAPGGTRPAQPATTSATPPTTPAAASAPPSTPVAYPETLPSGSAGAVYPPNGGQDGTGAALGGPMGLGAMRRRAQRMGQRIQRASTPEQAQTIASGIDHRLAAMTSLPSAAWGGAAAAAAAPPGGGSPSAGGFPGMMGGMEGMGGMMGGMMGGAPSAAGAGVTGEGAGQPAIPTRGPLAPPRIEAAPPIPPGAVRVVLVTDRGQLATGSLSLAEGIAEARGWARIDVPLSELKGSREALQGKVERIIVAGDRPGDFYLGQVAIVVEDQPLDFEVKLDLGAGGVARVEKVLTGEVKMADGVRADNFRVSWDFDDRDGLREDLAGRKVRFAYAEAGDYVVTVRVADIAGRRGWVRKEIPLVVEEKEETTH